MIFSKEKVRREKNDRGKKKCENQKREGEIPFFRKSDSILDFTDYPGKQDHHADKTD